MRYYAIRTSLNNKIAGTNPQSIHARHNCHIWDEPKFIDRVQFKRIDFEPITSNAIIEKKSKLTDLISSGGVGFTLKLLISGKLKKQLEKYALGKCQFFEAPVIFQDKSVKNYFIVNPYHFDLQNIDFENSTYLLKKKNKDRTRTTEIMESLSSDEFFDFIDRKEEIGYSQFFVENLKLKSEIKDSFFVLKHVEGGVKYLVSENLKQEIEDAGCTGIEFMPAEMRLTDWLHGGEREKIYGKA